MLAPNQNSQRRPKQKLNSVHFNEIGAPSPVANGSLRGSVMTTLTQDGLPKDTYVLKTMVNCNRLLFIGEGQFPYAGVYTVILKEGVVRAIDTVEID